MSRLRANFSAIAGHLAIATARAKVCASAPGATPASRFQTGGVMKATGIVSAEKCPPRRPRLRPKANAEAFASVGLAETNSTNAAEAWVFAISAAKSGAFVAGRPLFPPTKACREFASARRRGTGRRHHARLDQFRGQCAPRLWGKEIAHRAASRVRNASVASSSARIGGTPRRVRN